MRLGPCPPGPLGSLAQAWAITRSLCTCHTLCGHRCAGLLPFRWAPSTGCGLQGLSRDLPGGRDTWVFAGGAKGVPCSHGGLPDPKTSGGDHAMK